ALFALISHFVLRVRHFVALFKVALTTEMLSIRSFVRTALARGNLVIGLSLRSRWRHTLLRFLPRRRFDPAVLAFAFSSGYGILLRLRREAATRFEHINCFAQHS